MTRREIEDLVAQLPQPDPSSQLRSRVLATVVVMPVRLTWSDRVWFSRGWRMAGVIAALAIVAAEFASAPDRRGVSEPTPARFAEASAIEQGALSVEVLLDELMPKGGDE